MSVFDANAQRLAHAHRMAARLEELTPLSRHFFVSAAEGDVEGIREALADGADPDQRLSHGVSALMLACANGQAAAVEMLAALCGTEDADYGRNTALHKSATYGQAACARILLAQPHSDALRQARNSDGRTPFLCAALRGSPELIELFFSGSDLSAVDDGGNDALHLAASCGNPEAVELLLPLFDPNATNAEGETPLHVAASKSRVDALRLLAPHANPLAVDRHGRTPLISLAAAGDEPSALPNAWTPASFIPGAAELECCDALLGLGVSIAALDDAGLSALDWACLTGKNVLAKALFDASTARGLPMAKMGPKAAAQALQGNHRHLAQDVAQWTRSAADLQELLACTACADAGESSGRGKRL
jgi:ankyrin repeat protein